MRKSVKILQVVNIVGLLAVIAVNILADAIPVNDLTTAEVSARYKNLFTPAGFTFSIWGVIYVGLAAFVIYQSKGLFNNKFTQSKTIVAQLGLVFLISCLANVAWLYAWHYEQFTLSIILMALLLLSLIDINKRIHTILTKLDESLWLRWCLKIPFGLYLGWICVASIANVSVYLVAEGWDGFGISQHAWAIIMIFMSGLIGLLLLMRLRLFSAALVIVWGITGILFKIKQVDPDFILTIVGVVMIIVLIIGIISLLKKNDDFETENI